MLKAFTWSACICLCSFWSKGFVQDYGICSVARWSCQVFKPKHLSPYNSQSMRDGNQWINAPIPNPPQLTQPPQLSVRQSQSMFYMVSQGTPFKLSPSCVQQKHTHYCKLFWHILRFCYVFLIHFGSLHHLPNKLPYFVSAFAFERTQTNKMLT